MPEQFNSFIPEHGQRALIAGQTGFGKTAFGLWLLVRIPTTPTIVFDTKIEPKFDRLPNNKVVETVEEMLEAHKDHKIDYIIVRPPAEILGEPDSLDNYLWQAYLHLRDIVFYIDEGTSVHSSTGRPYKGLLSLFMRGRSKGITTIVSTQRPVGISRSIISEASKVYVFYLQDKRDREILDNVIPNFSKLPLPQKHGFYYWETGMTDAVLFEPIKLDKAFDTGYTDKPVDEDSKDGDFTSITTVEKELPMSKHVWV